MVHTSHGLSSDAVLVVDRVMVDAEGAAGVDGVVDAAAVDGVVVDVVVAEVGAHGDVLRMLTLLGVPLLMLAMRPVYVHCSRTATSSGKVSWRPIRSR
jgi:hypothetical protein